LKIISPPYVSSRSGLTNQTHIQTGPAVKMIRWGGRTENPIVGFLHKPPDGFRRGI
jgi:hypothetical protein